MKPHQLSRHKEQEAVDKSALLAALVVLGLGMTFLLAMTFLYFPEWMRLRAFATETRTPPGRVVTLRPPTALDLRPAMEGQSYPLQPTMGQGSPSPTTENAGPPPARPTSPEVFVEVSVPAFDEQIAQMIDREEWIPIASVAPRGEIADQLHWIAQLPPSTRGRIGRVPRTDLEDVRLRAIDAMHLAKHSRGISAARQILTSGVLAKANGSIKLSTLADAAVIRIRHQNAILVNPHVHLLNDPKMAQSVPPSRTAGGSAGPSPRGTARHSPREVSEAGRGAGGHHKAH